MKFVELLKKILTPFKILGKFISFIINFILLAIVYFIGIGLTSIIAKSIFKKHFLDIKGNNNWISIKNESKKIEDHERMY